MQSKDVNATVNNYYNDNSNAFRKSFQQLNDSAIGFSNSSYNDSLDTNLDERTNHIISDSTTVYFDDNGQDDDEDEHNFVVVSTLDDENFIGAALFSAIEDGNINTIKELFSLSRIDPNQKNKHGESLMHFCAGLGHLDIVKYLHQKGADITIIDDRGDSIIHWAARQNHPLIIRYFYDVVGTVDHVNKNLETPLHVAVRYGHVECIQQLCKCGTNVNAIDEHGETALLISVWHGFPKIVHILGEVGAQTDIRNKEGETALHVSCARGHTECVRCLLECSAKTDVKNKNSYTPLHLSLKRQHESVAKLLLRFGCDFEVADDYGDRPIHYASRSNLLEICQILCSLGCNVNVPNKKQECPLHLAAKNGHIEIVRCLCLYGSVIEHKNRESLIPEICAVTQNHNTITELLKRLKNDQTREDYIRQLTPTAQPIQRVKFKVFGNSGSGKTTMIESLKCGYFSSWFRRSTKSTSFSHSKKSSTSDAENNIFSDQITPTTTPTSTTTTSQNIFSFSANVAINNNTNTNCDNNFTKGIDCQQVTIAGVGDLSIWEFSGHESYYQMYDHFIGNTNCLHAIVFRLCDSYETQLQSVMFWLYFLQSRIPVLEPLTYRGKSSKPAKVIIIATHADAVNNDDELRLDLSNIMKTISNCFRNIFDIHEQIFVIDASVAATPPMKLLKQYLNSMKSNIVSDIPLTNAFLDLVINFLELYRKASSNFPVMSWNLFSEMIRSQVNPLASDNHLDNLILQLQTMGEILFFPNETSGQDLIVINPRWLTVDVIGCLLNSEYMHKRNISGIYSCDDIQLEFTEIDALDLVQVLESISLCVECDIEGDIAYEFPCFNLNEIPCDELWDKNNDAMRAENYVYSGYRFRCGEQMCEQILSCVLPRLQIALRKTIKRRPNFDAYTLENWCKASKYCCGLSLECIIMLANYSNRDQCIEVKFRGPIEMKTECFLFTEDTLNIIETTISEICPGFLFEKLYLSPKQLREHKLNVASYTTASILKVLLLSSEDDQQIGDRELLRKTVKSSESNSDGIAEEIIADIISCGVNIERSLNIKSAKYYSSSSARSLTSFLSSKSLQLSANSTFNQSEVKPMLAQNMHSSNLSLLAKQKLCAVLDPPEPRGCDWCMLGILLGMTDKLPKLDPGSNTQSSPTARVFDECQRESTCTIGVLVKKLLELARNDAIDVILQTAPILRLFPMLPQPEESALPYNDETCTVSSSGVSSGSHASSSNLSR